MSKNNTFLKTYSITLTLALIYLIVMSFKTDSSKQKFKEISVERINVVEPNGDLKMVISNSVRQHPGMFDGEVLMDRKRPPGMIFFNEEQDEVGGLVYSGNEDDGMGVALSVDQYKSDQVMQMLYERYKNGKQQYGLNIWDRADHLTLPQMIKTLDSLKKVEGITKQKIGSVLKDKNKGEPIAAQRLFTGKNVNEQVGVFINDEYGNPRIKIYIDENNQPKFELLDENGEKTDFFSKN